LHGSGQVGWAGLSVGVTQLAATVREAHNASLCPSPLMLVAASRFTQAAGTTAGVCAPARPAAR